MRVKATKDGLQIGPEYFPVEVCLQVWPTWDCPADEVVLHGTTFQGITDGQPAPVPNEYRFFLKMATCRMGQLIEARKNYELLKDAARLSRLKQTNANVLDDDAQDTMVLEKFGNIWRRKWKLNCGEHIRGHRHHFDHVSLLLTGSVNLIVDGVATVYTAPAEITVKAEKEHRVIALEDQTRWWCVFAVRDEAGDVDMAGVSMDFAATQ